MSNAEKINIKWYDDSFSFIWMYLCLMSQTMSSINIVLYYLFNMVVDP